MNAEPSATASHVAFAFFFFTIFFIGLPFFATSPFDTIFGEAFGEAFGDTFGEAFGDALAADIFGERAGSLLGEAEAATVVAELTLAFSALRCDRFFFFLEIRRPTWPMLWAPFLFLPMAQLRRARQM
eukprot:TRINITY_DN12091_c1_g2_i2.p1 TRINITY_DN12091_c1_g2~~TRINITY_DN12091_c1_g2_i2.p1  ORF type:complete len:128 (-),score=25.64 TRINITY_DN12091_c1_g2_i2:28-411(-)